MKKHKARKAAAGMRTCTDCSGVFELVEMAAGKRICQTCQNFRTTQSKEKKKPDQPEMEIAEQERSLQWSADSFDNRDALSEMIKGNLGDSVTDANEMVTLQKARMKVALDMKHPKLINEASKDLQAAMEHRSAQTVKLMEKLQAMEDLRLKQDKAKPVSFFYNRYPKRPRIVPMRSMPVDGG